MVPRSLDLFCHVIDNFGDAGVSLRFVNEFKTAHPGCMVRLFIDDLTALQAIEPSTDTARFTQDIRGITVINSAMLDTEHVASLGTAQIVIEAFACFIPECYLERALFASILIINLDYLSAETWTEGYHCRESLLPKGTAKKFFYMPGFTPATGGVILNSAVPAERKAGTQRRSHYLQTLLRRNNLPVPVSQTTLVGTIFSYERGFDTLLQELLVKGSDILLLCFGEKSRRSMESSIVRSGGMVYRNQNIIVFHTIRVVFMPFIPQYEYDLLLCHAQFNIVRGEDSLVRALLAGRPFIWHAYLQDEKYHTVKVEALLSMMQSYFEDAEVFSSLRQLFLQFNDATLETPQQYTGEEYDSFFVNLKKIEHSLKKLCYFIERNCNLIGKISEFINAF